MIDLLPSDEQEQIIDGARAMLGDRLPVDRLRTRRRGDPALEAWGDLVDFGWFLFGVPEDVGGVGAGVVEELLLAREAGQFLLPPSVLATTLAAQIAAEAGDAALVEALGSGEARAGFALAERDPAGGWLLIDAADATHLVTLTVEELHLAPAGAFVGRTTIQGIDETAFLERAQRSDEGNRLAASRAGTDRAHVLIAAVLAGIAEASLRLAVDYANIREQFGQPIGGFQAIKHRCADMAVRSETAGALVSMAALALVEGLEEADFQIWSAVLSALTAARENGADCIQVHGGMGFTWECHAHRYMKRAQLLTQLLGGPRAVEDRLLQ